MIMRQSKWRAWSQSDVSANVIRRSATALFLIVLGVWAWGPGLPQADASPEGSSVPAAIPTRAGLFAATDLSPSLRAALEHESNAERGRGAYTSCAVCHMDDGGGRPDGTFPRLAGQHASVLIKQLIDIREGRRANPLMLPYAKRLSGSQEIADVALYVSLLPGSSDNGKGTGQDLPLGAELYGRDCASCHGFRGEGDAARFIPALAGQHYGYMLRQIRDIGAGRRGNAHPDMESLVAGYSDAELMALVDYASRIRNEVPGE
jgi:cytochrome c553